MPKFFRCARTGLLFPGDYIEQWGKKYGIGLGSEPVSEALVNMYEFPIARHKDDPMLSSHPVAVCRAQVDLIDLTEKQASAETKAILAINDVRMERRSAIMRERQQVHSSEIARIYEDEQRFRGTRVETPKPVEEPVI